MSTTQGNVIYARNGGEIVKVLFQIRLGYWDSPSGDSVQMLMTKTYLEKLGVDVCISSRQDISLNEFDLIHIFNTTRLPEAYGFYKNAMNQKKKIVISPIFIDMRRYYQNKPARLAAWRAENLFRREMLQGSHMLLPNSKKEWEWIQNILMVDTREKIIYHGVDPVFFDADKDRFVNKFGIENFILCVGRLSPIKNQLSLIRAVKDLNIPIVLIGPVNDRRYAIECAEAADGCVKYIPPMNQRELASAYCAARVHAQPSWFETVGLTSLEAAASGTPVVITSLGGTREYFEDRAVYVEPDSLDSIREGILAAMRQQTNIVEKNVEGKNEQSTEGERRSAESEKEGKDFELKTYIRERFTWEKTARDTLEAYEQVLADDCQPKTKESFYSQTYILPEPDKR